MWMHASALATASYSGAVSRHSANRVRARCTLLASLMATVSRGAVLGILASE